jgi:hypothetical protein
VALIFLLVVFLVVVIAIVLAAFPPHRIAEWFGRNSNHPK